MRAILCESHVSPAQLTIRALDKPAPGPEEVLVRVEACGLGYVDALMVAGLYQIKPPLPYVPGSEIAGVVKQVGEEVEHIRAGQRILATTSGGGLAEYVCLEESRCIPIPDQLSFDAAASFLVNYCTAFHGFRHCGGLEENETVLILGAGGGVGMAAIDVARAMGAYVIAAASTRQKRNACLEAGANALVDYNIGNWRDELKKILAGRPLDLVYDPVGGDYTEPALRSLGPDGRLLVVGFAAGKIPQLPANLVLLKRCAIAGVNWGGHIAANPSESRRVLTTLLDWIASGRLHPRAGEKFPLKQAGAAMMKMLNRKAVGKIIIQPGANARVE